MKFILILMLYHFNGDKIARTEYMPVPGVWTKNVLQRWSKLDQTRE
jgi:hypothetical protein